MATGTSGADDLRDADVSNHGFDGNHITVGQVAVSSYVEGGIGHDVLAMGTGFAGVVGALARRGLIVLTTSWKHNAGTGVLGSRQQGQ